MRRRRFLAAGSASAILLAAACVSGGSARISPDRETPCSRAFVFVDKGRPAAAIEIPADGEDHARRAAEILQSSIRKMCGLILPVRAVAAPGRSNVAAVGFSGRDLPPELAAAALSLRRDGFLAAVSNRNLYISGGGGKGVIYGVVHLLEKYFGCRRYSPEAEVFPRRNDLALGCLFETDNPVNDVRIVHGEFARDSDYRDWMRLHVQDEIYAAGFHVHTFHRLVPWQTYFAPRPEYFAWMNGKRIIDQPCLSRPEVFDIVVSALREEMARRPDKTFWSVSQNDNFSYCRCPECEKIIEEEGSPSGPIIRFVNRVAELFPDKTISTLAYQYSRRAPRLARPAPNVEVMLCTIELNRSLPIDEDPASATFVRDLEDWSRICGNLYLWDYTVNFSHHVAPFPNLHVLQPNIRLFVRHGVRRHFQQSNTGPGHEFSELKSYLLARLLWNPDADVAALTDEFLEGYYGKAGPHVGRYIDAMREAVARTAAALDIYEPPAAHADDTLSAANVAAYDELLLKAEAAAAGDPAAFLRAKTARLPLMYARLEIGMNDMFGPRGFYSERGGRFAAKPEMARLLDDFLARCEAAGVRTLNESGLSPKTYYDAAKRFTDVQIEGNLAFRKPVSADPPPAPKYAKGDTAVLTNGVRGAGDFRVHWLGWEGTDLTLILDLGRLQGVREISLATLSDLRSWILHPERVACAVSADGDSFRAIGEFAAGGDHRGEEVVRSFVWRAGEGANPDAFGAVRLVRFRIEGTKRLPDWHASAGGASWVFVDEITVR